MMNWCDKQEKPIYYIIGIARNPRLEKQADFLIKKARDQYEQSGKKQRLFSDIRYAAQSWKYKRRIIIKAEHSSKGKNPRFLVTNLMAGSQKLYEKISGEGELKSADKSVYPSLSIALKESTSVPDLLELAMQAEKASEEFYDQLSEETEERGVQEILQYLASMEHSHYFLLKGEYDLCVRDESYYERDDFHTDMVHIGP